MALIEAHLGTTFPALALAVFHADELVLDAAWGHLDPETQRRLALPSSLFDLASLTKLFTATAFLQHASAGRARLDDPLVTVVPEFAAVQPRGVDGGQDPHSKVQLPTPDDLRDLHIDPARVTFRHLLTHT
ncbi:MAG: beta-lactamase family protein, partial [Chloroflexi bacterium]|nr:beta-lactamase family protein [Chloroflexota bacterium]